MSSVKTKLKVYVGCSLTHASEEFKQQVEDFKAELRKHNCEVFDFVGLVAGTAADVYNWDLGHCVKDADIFVGICDFPSIGLGAELMEAVRLKKRVLAVAHTDTKVTRMVLGMAEVEPNVTFARYDDLTSEIIPLVQP